MSDIEYVVVNLVGYSACDETSPAESEFIKIKTRQAPTVQILGDGGWLSNQQSVTANSPYFTSSSATLTAVLPEQIGLGFEGNFKQSLPI
jgi:hypothetical protein